MMEATRQEEILFLGGAWGGYIFTDFLFASDGMYSVGKILEMLAQTGMKISQIDEQIPRRYQHTISVHCPWKYKGSVMRKAMEYSENLERQLVEGVKIFDGKDSVLLLPSKETDSFQIIAGADSDETAISSAKKYEDLVIKWRDED